jgi:hypothetical protein
MRFLTIPLPIMPRPRNPKLRFEGWMSLSRRILDDDVRSSECETGISAVGLSRSEETAVDEALFLLKRMFISSGIYDTSDTF